MVPHPILHLRAKIILKNNKKINKNSLLKKCNKIKKNKFIKIIKNKNQINL
jgi:hypothetical protein